MKTFAIDDWLPKLAICLRTYDRKQLSADLIAGLTVGFVALPLAMAFGISSGLTPQAGLYTAIIAGFIAAALSGSRVQVSGPTGAFVVVVFGIVAKHGVDGLIICTLLAGAFLLLLGMTGLGSAVKFIPRPVVIGFTNGIAILIASTQIKDFFGLQVAKIPGDFIPRMQILAAQAGTFTPAAVGLSLTALAIIIGVNRYLKRIPGAIVALLVCTLASVVLKLPVETIGSKFGKLPQHLPPFHFPAIDPSQIGGLLSPALTIAMLGAIESLLSAVVADRMIKDKHNPNVELIAQGAANIASALFGGLPATGAIARTATNVKAGAKTPVSAMVHAVVLLVILLFAAPLAGYIPLCVLAAILMVVAYNMGEWREIPAIVKLSKADLLVWINTFLLTVFADLTVAVQSGMILAALMFISRVTSTTTVSKVDKDYLDNGQDHVLQDKDMPEGIAMFRIHGPFLFGATDKIDIVTDDLEHCPPVIILRLRNMNAIDTTGVQALEELAHAVRESNREIIFCGMRDQPLKFMRSAGFPAVVGEKNLCANAKEALARASELLTGQSSIAI